MLKRLRLKIGNRVFRPGLIAAAIALAVTVAAGGFAEHQNRVLYRQQARSDVGEELGLLRARLEANITSNIQLVRGLVAVIAAEPDIDQERFSQIVAGLMKDSGSQLRNIGAAPDLVIRMMYPMAGNERAIGLDYRDNAAQRDAALRAAETGKMVLAGPVNLMQGGQGFVARLPVFVDTAENGSRLWGLVSAVIDVDRLYADSGLLDFDLGLDHGVPLDIAIAGKDADEADSTVFFGSADVFKQDPVLAEVTLPVGSWRLAAIPHGGWSGSPPTAWRFRLVLLLAGVLVVLPVVMAGNLYDQRRAHGRELQRLSQRLKLAVETSRIGIWELNLDTMVMTWDDRMKELYGIPADVDAKTYEHWRDALHPDDRERAEAEFETAIAAGSAYRSEYRVVLPDGSVRWVRAAGNVQDDSRTGHSIIGVNWDVSADIEMNKRLLAAKQSAETRNRELENARAQMEYNSLHDSLTGLPNRRFLDERLLHPQAGHRIHALLHIDLDRFKEINDTLGHAAGDAMLVHAASVLKASIRSDDIVARIGGDEFVIAVTAPITEEQLSALSDRIVEELRRPVPYKNHLCRFGVSIGVATANEEDDNGGRGLLIDADIALYRAKKSGRGRHEFFSNALKAEIVQNKRVADDILNGLDRGEFLPHFQPQFDAKTLDIAGVEALARWRHPTEGLLGPDQFLAIADELNVVPLLDRTILEQGLWQAKRWKAAGLSIPRISVNVSAGQLHDVNLIKRLDGLAIEPGTLSFELLESTFLDEEDETLVGNVGRLKEMGIDIEIDDFGTGYASIISLVHLWPARLKIDRRLITPIVGSKSQQRVVASIIDIGQSLGIKVVAEGVETMQHAAILRDLGCDTLQGYAFAAPMSSEDLIEFIRAERWRAVA